MNWKQIAGYVNTTIKVLRIIKNVIKRITQEFLDQKIIEEETQKAIEANEVVT